jgi:hypothetical protein
VIAMGFLHASEQSSEQSRYRTRSCARIRRAEESEVIEVVSAVMHSGSNNKTASSRMEIGSSGCSSTVSSSAMWHMFAPSRPETPDEPNLNGLGCGPYGSGVGHSRNSFQMQLGWGYALYHVSWGPSGRLAVTGSGNI